MSPICFIITSIILFASINPMIKFKNFLQEQKENSVQQDDPFEGNETIRKIYGGLATAEHGLADTDDPYAFNPKTYIRTKYDKNSTAYGPVQITYKTAKGFYNQDKKLFGGNEAYTQQFLNQGRKMLKAKKGDKQYDLGCTGDLCNQTNHSNYQRMANSIIKGKMKEIGIDPTKPLSDTDRDRFVDHWRYGAGSKKSTRQLDSRYYNAFTKSFNK